MTCNPNWPEIKDNLLPGQEPKDHPDLVCQVFKPKLKKNAGNVKIRYDFWKTMGLALLN